MRSVNPTCSGITQGQSTFYVNNPEIAPPLAADTLTTDVAEATASVDLLGLGGVKEEKPEEELLPGFPSTTTRDTSSPKPPGVAMRGSAWFTTRPRMVHCRMQIAVAHR